MNTTERKKFIQEWLGIRRGQGGQDYAVASFSWRLAKALDDRAAFVLFCVNDLEQTPAVAAKGWKMATVFEQINEAAVWRALGWRGVDMAHQVQDVEARSKILAAVRAGGEAQPRSKWIKAFEKHAPSVIRSRSGGGGFSSEKARADLLAKVVRKLLAIDPSLVRALTDKERKEAGIPEAQSKAG